MCNCASENSSSTHSTNQVDYDWDDALSQAFKANVNSADDSTFKNTSEPIMVNTEAIDASTDCPIASQLKYKSTAEDKLGISYKTIDEPASQTAINGHMPNLLHLQFSDARPIVENDELRWPKDNSRSVFSLMANRLSDTDKTCSRNVAAPMHVRASETTCAAHTNKLVDYKKDDFFPQALISNNDRPSIQ
ncbi:hypothetical protein EB796_014722 [Bugula neritina]|uniref:Uncharacterized protein n=1 Tax=Bugula neritina TaxID=10212 RepID=A0A7J7JKU8_BUGNE|nr:hypothetical protein EB796_014722 [Bugula neritina]